MNLNQVTLGSKNVQEAVTFYSLLGLEQIVDNLPRYARFKCPDGNSTFSIHLVEKLTHGEFPIIYFECENLDAMVTKLKKKGVKFIADPKDQPWLWREAYLKDPDENIICLYYAGKNRIDPPWKISR
jgi:predicted enzyme related to lactoylglutathione lyase